MILRGPANPQVGFTLLFNIEKFYFPPACRLCFQRSTYVLWPKVGPPVESEVIVMTHAAV